MNTIPNKSESDFLNARSAGLGFEKTNDSKISAVSWPAILAGSTTSLALLIVLVMLGMGLGSSMTSPWQSKGVSAETLGITAVIWFGVIQIIAYGFGGYISGRLRTKWVAIHDHEVYFRDTAHGMLSWAISCIIVSILLVKSLGGVLNLGANAIDNAAPAMMRAGSVMSHQRDNDNAGNIYSIEKLFRPQKWANEDEDKFKSTQKELTKLFLFDLQKEILPQEDQDYFSQVLAARKNISKQQAENNVVTTYDELKKSIAEKKQNAKIVLEKSRKQAAWISLWIFIAMLTGGFVSSISATFGGRQRDSY